MWIAKGLFLGIWLFSFGTLAYLYLALYRHLQPNTAVGIDIFYSLLIRNPFWWIGIIACFAIGLLITRSWSGRPILWIALAVTESVPVGILGMFLMLVHKMKQAAGR
jgi:hypothetical protein